MYFGQTTMTIDLVEKFPSLKDAMKDEASASEFLKAFLEVVNEEANRKGLTGTREEKGAQILELFVTAGNEDQFRANLAEIAKILDDIKLTESSSQIKRGLESVWKKKVLSPAVYVIGGLLIAYLLK